MQIKLRAYILSKSDPRAHMPHVMFGDQVLVDCQFNRMVHGTYSIKNDLTESDSPFLYKTIVFEDLSYLETIVVFENNTHF